LPVFIKAIEKVGMRHINRIRKVNLIYSLAKDETFDYFFGIIWRCVKKFDFMVYSKPSQWLVYDVRNDVLTRFCFVKYIHGDVRIVPFARKSILLEVVGDVKLISPKYLSSARYTWSYVNLMGKVDSWWKGLVAGSVSRISSSVWSGSSWGDK